MKKLFLGICLIGLGLLMVFASPATAQVGKGLSGPHYNLNIIGVPHDKTVPDMTGSNRHTIFVPLQSGGDVGRKVSINYVAGTEFRVIDGNATDDNEATIEVPSAEWGNLSFEVYAVGLGKPNGVAIVTAECAIDDLIGECVDALLLDSFTVKRTRDNGPAKNKPQLVDITDIFRATGCIDVIIDGVCTAGDIGFKNIWIFNIPELEYYLWDYENNDLKLMQVRFYETTSGEVCDGPCT